MEHTTIAVDLAKSVFQVAISHRAGRVDVERRLSRDRCLPFFAQQPPATVLLEACGSEHHWARQIQPFGHVVRLLPPHDVRPYVRRHKTDRTDAKGLLEANRNDEIHPVPVKTIEHQAVASLHRLRSTCRHPALSLRAAFRKFLGTDAQGGFDRPAPTARGHQQARRRVLADAADARCPIISVACEDCGTGHHLAALGRLHAAATGPQHRRQRRRQ